MSSPTSIGDALISSISDNELISHSFDEHEDALTFWKILFEKDLPMELIPFMTNHSYCVSSLVVQKGMVVPISFIQAVKDGNRLALIGSARDSFTDPVPVKLDIEKAENFIVSGFPKQAMTDFNMYDLPAKDPLSYKTADDKSHDEILGYDRSGSATSPGFGCLPVILPLPVGSIMPKPFKLLTDDIPFIDVEKDVLKLAWTSGMKVLENFDNQGKSLHATNKIYADPINASASYRLLSFNSSSHMNYQLLERHDPLYQKVIDVIKKRQREVTIEKVCASPIESLIGKVTPTPAHPIIQQPVINDHNVFVDSINSVVNKDKNEKKQFQRSKMMHYKILCCCEKNIYDENNMHSGSAIQCAELSDQWTNFMMASSNEEAATYITHGFPSHVRHMKASSHKIKSAGNMTVDQFGLIERTALRNFHWASSDQNLADNENLPKSYLMICHFAKSYASSLADRVEAEAESGRQESVGVTDAKRARKASELFFNGSMSTGSDLLNIIGNIFLMVYFWLGRKCSDTPILLTCLSQFFDTLNDIDGQNWMQRNCVYQSIIVNNILLSIQKILGAFVSLATNPDVIAHVQTNNTIPHEFLKNVKTVADYQHTELYRAIHNDSLIVFGVPNASLKLLNPLAKIPFKSTDISVTNNIPVGRSNNNQGAGRNSNRNSERRTGGARTNGHPSSSTTNQSPPATATSTPIGGNTSATNDRRERGRQSGLFIYTGSNRNIPFPQFLVNGKVICGFFVFRGLYCNNPNCRHLHITRLQDLCSDADRTAVRDFEATTEGVEWAPSTNPTGNLPQ